jgi:hypothetical protein
VPAEGYRPVQRFEIATWNEAEAKNLIRQVYSGNRTRFHGVHDGGRFTVTGADAGTIAAGHGQYTTISYSTLIDPMDYFLSPITATHRSGTASRRRSVRPGRSALTRSVSRWTCTWPTWECGRCGCACPCWGGGRGNRRDRRCGPALRGDNPGPGSGPCADERRRTS